MKTTKTYSTRASDIKREWHFIDAANQTIGRLSTQVAGLLMGKHKPRFTPNLDTGDFVVVTNAGKIHFTGNSKATDKMYYRHSGYPGGLKSASLEKLMETDPTRVIEHAIKGMLPHTKLGASMRKRLKIYRGETHPHMGQVKTTVAEVAK